MRGGEGSDAGEVNHGDRVWANGDRSNGERPECGRCAKQSTAGREEPVTPGESCGLEQQPAENPVDLRQIRDPGEPNHLEGDKQQDATTGD